jgi:hypothetical protein
VDLPRYPRPAGQHSEVYQAPNHDTLPFTGAKEGNHPLLQTSTSNNNLTQVTDPAFSSGYRFFMDPSQTLPDNRAREVVMDENPWSYQIMAKEMVREGKIEANPDPATPEVSDQRNYLFIEIDKDTTYATTPASGNWVGTAVAVKLKGDNTWYTSNHDIPDWSIQRDIPAATTVELPPGTTVTDVKNHKGLRRTRGHEPERHHAGPERLHHTLYGHKQGLLPRQQLPAGLLVHRLVRRCRTHAAEPGGDRLAVSMT